MERLEAALEKARASRKQLRRPKSAPGASPAGAAEVAEHWHQLKQIKLSGLTARQHRITALATGRNSGPYDLLRSRSLRLMEDNGWSSMAITSPNANCGKTTVCANLAFSIARQNDLRVLVLDMDLRRPSLHRVLSNRPSSSLHEYLQGKVQASDQLVRYGENLAFGLNSQPAKNSAELLQSKMTRNRLELLQQQYQPDITLIDLPPMLAGDDNVGFLPRVDCGLLVAAAESTTMNQLDVCEKELAGLTNVLGVVLNKCRFHDSESGYEHDYY